MENMSLTLMNGSGGWLISYNCWISLFDSFFLDQGGLYCKNHNSQIWTVNSNLNNCLLFHVFRLGECLPLSLIFFFIKFLLPELLLKSGSLMKWLTLNHKKKNTSLSLLLFPLVVGQSKRIFSFLLIIR